MTTVTNGQINITPILVTGYDAAQDTRTIRHDIIGRASADYSLNPAGPRTGTLEMLFDREDVAEQARVAHMQVAIWSLYDPDRWTLPRAYVVQGGQLGHVLEDSTRNVWLIRVPYAEVTG